MLAFLLSIVYLQLFFVRELLFAELLFAAGFCILLTFVGVCYFVGLAGVRSCKLIAHEAGNLTEHAAHARDTFRAQPLRSCPAERESSLWNPAVRQ